MKIRNDIYKEVQVGLNAGKRKEQIYNELKEKYPAASVERSLAQWPYPEAKVKNRFLNVPLLIIALFFALIKLLIIIGIFQKLEPSKILMVLPFTLFPLAIYGFVIYGIKNYNLIGYLLTVLFLGVQNLLSIAQFGQLTPKSAMLLVMSLAALVLAWIQKSRLFPNTSWFMRHKKDSAGNIIF